MDIQKFDLHVVTGNLGTGKTTTSRRIQEGLGVPWVEPDLMRKELGMVVYDPKDTPKVMSAVWDRVIEALYNRQQITLCTPYVRRSAREQCYGTLQEISNEIGRDLQAVLLRCECSEATSRLRIDQREKTHLPPFNPKAYDRVRAQNDPLSEEEVSVNPNISFLIFNTEENRIQPLSIREQHAVAIDNLVKILQPNG